MAKQILKMRRKAREEFRYRLHPGTLTIYYRTKFVAMFMAYAYWVFGWDVTVVDQDAD